MLSDVNARVAFEVVAEMADLGGFWSKDTELAVRMLAKLFGLTPDLPIARVVSTVEAEVVRGGNGDRERAR